MKKLMAIAAVAAGLSASAAQYNWAFDAEGNDPFGGATYYAFNGDVASYVSLLTTDGKGYDAFAEAVAALDASTYATGTLDGSGAGGGSETDYFANAADTFGVIVLTGTDAGSTFYYNTISTDGYTYTPPAGAPDTLTMYAFSELGDLDMSTGTIVGTPVPEPTSGLLLVLGMAGLALKRKRA